jgi:hypothetical protein
MKVLPSLLLYLLLGTGLAQAGMENDLLSTFAFGEAPQGDMLCTAGPCAAGETALTHRAPTQAVAYYKKTRDMTHIGGVEISAPVYGYYQEELFQVFFKLLGPAEEGERLVDALLDRLRERSAVTLLQDHFNADGPGEARHDRIYLLDNGWLVSASRTQEDGRWQPPHIRLYEPRRMDQVRLAFNPDYRSHGY